MARNRLGLAGLFLAGAVALGNQAQSYACNEENEQDTAIAEMSKRTGYNKDKIYGMIYSALDRMMSIPDQQSSSHEIVTQRQNNEMKAEIGKKMLYNLADKLGNGDYMTSDDEVCNMLLNVGGPRANTLLEKLLVKHLHKNKSYIDEKDVRKHFPGLKVFDELKNTMEAHIINQIYSSSNYNIEE